MTSSLGELNPCGGGDPIPLLHEKLLVGRRSSCDISLRFPNVSSHHCELELINGYWQVRDLGSRNGVKVNGERVETRFLMPGDVLQVARHRFELDYEPEGDGTAPEEENPLSRGLLEKAGLDPTGHRTRTNGSPKKANVPTVRSRSEDDFYLEWLSD